MILEIQIRRFRFLQIVENIGRYRQALICLEKLASLEDPEYSELILFKKGIIFRDMGLVNKAQKAFQTWLIFIHTVILEHFERNTIHRFVYE